MWQNKKSCLLSFLILALKSVHINGMEDASEDVIEEESDGSGENSMFFTYDETGERNIISNGSLNRVGNDAGSELCPAENSIKSCKKININFDVLYNKVLYLTLT